MPADRPVATGTVFLASLGELLVGYGVVVPVEAAAIPAQVQAGDLPRAESIAHLFLPRLLG
jgi:hypothetical protein